MITVQEYQSGEHKTEYNFNEFGLDFVLVGVKTMVKPKGKRIWRVDKQWDKYNERHSNLEKPDVVPPHIKAEVKLIAIDRIKVMTWQEFKPKD